MSNKLSFSLKASKKKSTTAVAAAAGFEPAHDEAFPQEDHDLNPDLPKEPLVIPVQKDARQSLQEQARLRRQQQQPQQVEEDSAGKTIMTETNDAEDQAAIQALNAQAGKSNEAAGNPSKMVIQGAKNTFQRKEDKDAEEAQQLQQDLERLVPEVSVESEVYRQVPIADFGAAMLRGMGWTGQVDTSDRDSQNMPRPSRLGLGATPKLLDAPTHGRKPRRQDQVKRDEQLKQQQEEFEKARAQQIKLDKQRTTQDGSIVRVQSSTRRAIIRKWQGVPGLNMTLVQFEGEEEPVKVKKGDIRLLERQELQQDPFREPAYDQVDKVEYVDKTRHNSKDRDRRRDEDRSRHSDDNGKGKKRDYEDRRRRSDDERSNSDDRHRGKDEQADGRDKKHRPDRDRHEDRKRSRQAEDNSYSRTSTWLVPHIRVRVVSSKLGKRYYKEKGVVVDVTRKGTATLTMSNGQVIQVHERYLETALPKVGGNACILNGEHRLAKGRLLERDSRANRGAVQVFEDMNIVTTSLDDMAEWCGPLDDDLME